MTQTLDERCAAALECLPDAQYRTMLARLLDDMRAGSPDLHAAIMNLPCNVPPGYPFGSDLCAGVYRQGHRDARHAAAELVPAAPLVQPAPARLSIQRLLAMYDECQGDWCQVARAVEDHHLAAIPAVPPLTLSDEQIDELALQHSFVSVNREGRFTAVDKSAIRRFARALLAARPEQAPEDEGDYYSEEAADIAESRARKAGVDTSDGGN